MNKLKALLDNIELLHKQETQELANRIKVQPISQVYDELAEQYNLSTVAKCDAIVNYVVETIKIAEYRDQIILLELLNYATDPRRYTR